MFYDYTDYFNLEQQPPHIICYSDADCELELHVYLLNTQETK